MILQSVICDNLQFFEQSVAVDRQALTDEWNFMRDELVALVNEYGEIAGSSSMPVSMEPLFTRMIEEKWPKDFTDAWCGLQKRTQGLCLLFNDQVHQDFKPPFRFNLFRRTVGYNIRIRNNADKIIKIHVAPADAVRPQRYANALAKYFETIVGQRNTRGAYNTHGAYDDELRDAIRKAGHNAGQSITEDCFAEAGVGIGYDLAQRLFSLMAFAEPRNNPLHDRALRRA